MIRVWVISTYPVKRSDVILKTDATFADLKKESEVALKLQLAAYDWALVSFGHDAISLKHKKNEDKILEKTQENVIFVAIAPQSIKPTRRMVKDHQDTREEDEKFKGLTFENIWTKLSAAKEKKTKNICYEYLDLFSSDILKGKAFLRLPLKSVSEIVKRDSLTAQEIEIFNAVVAWGHYQLKLKDEKVSETSLKGIINDLLPFVRFPLLTTEEVASRVVPTGVLNASQVLDLFTYLAQKHAGVTPGPSLSGFNSKLRTGSGRYGVPGKKMANGSFIISSIQGSWCYGSYDNCHSSSQVPAEAYDRVLGFFNGLGLESYKVGDEDYNLPRSAEANAIYSYPASQIHAIEFKFTKGPAFIKQFRFLSTRLENGVTISVFSRKNSSSGSWGDNQLGSNVIPFLSNGGGLKQWIEITFPKALFAEEFRIEVRNGQCAIHIVQFINGP